MIGRAELAFVVLELGYTQHGVIQEKAFFTLMFTCFLLNISVPICITLWKPY